MNRRTAVRLLGAAVATGGVAACGIGAAPALLAPPRAVTNTEAQGLALSPARTPSPAPVVAVAEAATAVPAATVAPTATPTPVPLATIPVQPTVTPAPTATAVPQKGGPLGPNRLVTWYGHPDSELMGILGEFADPRAMIGGLKAQTKAYTDADPAHPAIPTLELIASVASHLPNDDGLYLNVTRAQTIERFVQMAHDNDCLLLLDIQFGYDTMENEVNRLLPYLKLPHVHLAIDPEFKVKRGQVPGQVYGSVTAAEVNYAANLLANLVKGQNLPDKVLVLHQFRYDVFPDKPKIRPVPGVQMVVMMDGFGGTEAKVGNYGAFVRDEPIQFGGIKLFYKQDKPVMAPKEIISLSPSPLVVSYQ